MNKEIITNLAIYDTLAKTTSYFFDNKENQQILDLVYETGYDRRERSMDFYTYRSSKILHNRLTEERPAVNKIILLREGKKKGTYEFWQSDKKGENKILLHTSNSKDQWRIDVKNRKLLFFEKTANEVHVEEYAW